MLEIPVVKGNINKALKLFKRKFKQTGILKKLENVKTILNLQQKEENKKKKQY